MKFKMNLHSHLQVTVFCFAPLRHGSSEHALVVVVKIALVVVDEAVTKLSHRIPVYWAGQMHEHEEAIKKPPFKHESKPHLHMFCWHIWGQYIAIAASVHFDGPKSVKHVVGWLLQFENSHSSPFFIN